MSDQQWFDEWMRAWRSFPGADMASANPWAAALDHFTKTHHAAYPQAFAEAVDKLTAQSRAFFELGEQLAGNGRDDWQQSVMKHLEWLTEQAGDPGAAAATFAGASPLDYWRRFAGQDASSPSDHSSFLAKLDKTLQTPGLGYTRELQEAMQELSRRWLTYETAYGEYAAYCAETTRRSLEKLRDRLREAFENGEGPESVRALYDAWVDCSEEVYAERAATSEYMTLHGRMVNTLMAYRQQSARIMDQWADAQGLPTRREVDALHRKLKETRQALRALQARLGDDEGGTRG